NAVPEIAETLKLWAPEARVGARRNARRGRRRRLGRPGKRPGSDRRAGSLPPRDLWHNAGMARARRYLRSFEAGGLLETFLTAAVAALLGIRFFLRLAGYPQLGGSHLHVAHMLWGGVLMAAAIILLL